MAFARLNSLAPWCLALSLMLGLAPAQAATSALPDEAVTLNFLDAEIADIARTMAVLSGRNVVVDPRVKGKLTLVTDTPVKPDQALTQFASALRQRDFALIETGQLLKVVPEAEAKLQSTQVNVRSPRNMPANQVVTQIFQVQHENANSLVPVLRPLISPNNTINVSGNNALIITDYAENLVRIEQIIAALDVGEGLHVARIGLQHSIASDTAGILKTLLDQSTSTRATAKAPATSSSNDTTILADPRNNALIVSAATATRLDQVRQLVKELDVAPQDGGDIHVVHLKNAQAKDLAVTLRAALGAAASNTSSNSSANATKGAAPATSTGGMIQADEATNSLIISAPAPQMRELRTIIDQLDGRRAQVFVEGLIAEVSAEKAAEFGIQWQGPLGNAGSGTIGLLGTNFNSGGNNIIALATGAASGQVAPGAGLNVGAVTRQNGVYVLGFLGRFLQENGDANILSTPTLLTLDNQEAKIVIGQNVPFVTGQYTNNNASSGTVNPFQTIERKDVGLTLKVKPQISESGVIKLDIFQEVSNVSDTSSAGLITNKRSIESSVLVDSGQIVVLGGLLQDTFGNTQQGVPGLSDIPVLGGLFKYEARKRKKTNLMVFIRPVIVPDAQASERLSLTRYDAMQQSMQAAQPAPSDLLDVDGSPVLPPVRSIDLSGGQR
jgi:general secretion pathway protein D